MSAMTAPHEIGHIVTLTPRQNEQDFPSCLSPSLRTHARGLQAGLVSVPVRIVVVHEDGQALHAVEHRKGSDCSREPDRPSGAKAQRHADELRLDPFTNVKSVFDIGVLIEFDGGTADWSQRQTLDFSIDLAGLGSKSRAMNGDAAASLFIEQGWSPKKVQVGMVAEESAGRNGARLNPGDLRHLWASLENRG